MSGSPNSEWSKARRDLTVAVAGALLMAGGSLGILLVQMGTRGRMQEVLAPTSGLIRTDEQLRILNGIMSRGLMLSIGAVCVVGVGVLCAVLGLGFFLRRQGRLRPAGDGD